MKTILTAAIVTVLALNVTAGEPKGENPDKYCVRVKDGKKEVRHMGMTLSKEVTLDDGTKINPDGSVVKKDGTRTTLQEGECVDKSGYIANENKTKNNKNNMNKKNKNDNNMNDKNNNDKYNHNDNKSNPK